MTWRDWDSLFAGARRVVAQRRRVIKTGDNCAKTRSALDTRQLAADRLDGDRYHRLLQRWVACSWRAGSARTRLAETALSHSKFTRKAVRPAATAPTHACNTRRGWRKMHLQAQSGRLRCPRSRSFLGWRKEAGVNLLWQCFLRACEPHLSSPACWQSLKSAEGPRASDIWTCSCQFIMHCYPGSTL